MKNKENIDNYSDHYKEYLEKKVIPKYIDEQKKKPFANGIISLRPDLGYYIEVNGYEIAEKAFPDEYNSILMAFNNFVDKLKNGK